MRNGSRSTFVAAALALTIVTGSPAQVLAQQATPASPPAAANPSLISVTHGVASGDVTATSAIIWARASQGPAQMHVEYATDPAFTNAMIAQTEPGAVTDATDYTAQIKLNDLTPDTTYYYRVWFTANPEEAKPVQGAVPGMFRTAPSPDTSRPIAFTVIGDIGGQGFCRRPEVGYRIFTPMLALEPDFVIANGDSIYADGACPADGPASGPADFDNIPGDFPAINDPAVDWTNLSVVTDVYVKHWRYNRADPHFQRFLAHTPVYAQWDDHEVINDFGAQWDYQNKETQNRPGFPNLVQAGREAFFWFQPLDRIPGDESRIYRSFTWGKDLELFLADCRSYRSRNDEPDGPNHTLLGAEQLTWLKQGLQNSTATWKVVSFDVPISIPTGSNAAEFGRDGWANGTATDFSAQTGFERELTDLLTFIDDNNIQNVAFVVTDVHFAMTISYSADLNGDGDTVDFFEFVSGPVNAISVAPPEELDPTFNPTVVYKEGNLFNYSFIRIEPGTDGTAHLVADVRGEDGLPRPGSRVELIPRS